MLYHLLHADEGSVIILSPNAAFVFFFNLTFIKSSIRGVKLSIPLLN